MLGPVLLEIWVHAVQPAEVFGDELLGIEIHWITWTALALSDIGKDGQSVIVGDEEMQPPPAFWVRLQMVEKPMVALLDQFSAKAVAVGFGCTTTGSPHLHLLEPRGSRVGARSGTILGRRNPDGPKVVQKAGGKGL